METKELAELITPALEKIIEERISRYIAENEHQIAMAYIERCDDVKMKILLADAHKDDLLPEKEITDEIVRDWLFEHRDDDVIIDSAIPDDIQESLVINWISDNPVSAGDEVNSSISDADARDLVENLISNHW